MKKPTLREMMNAVDKALEKGDLRVTNKNKEEDENSICSICKNTTNMSNCYSWFILNDEDYPDVLQMMFCTKECWKKYLNKEDLRMKWNDN